MILDSSLMYIKIVMNITRSQYREIANKKLFARNNATTSPRNDVTSLSFTSNITRKIDKKTAQTIYSGARTLIDGIENSLGKGYFEDLLNKAQIDFNDDTLTYANRTFLKDAFATLKAIVEIPFRFTTNVAKKMKINISDDSFLGAWLKKHEQEISYNKVVDIIDEYVRPVISKEGNVNSQRANKIFSDTIGSNITRVKKNYESRDERTLNRVATSIVSALYSGADFYNISMLQKDDKNEASKAQKRRLRQELTRMGLSAAFTFLTLGVFDRYTKKNIWLNASVIAGSTLLSEILSRIFSKTPLIPLTSKEAAKISQKRKNSPEERQKITFRANLKNEQEEFRSLLKSTPTLEESSKKLENKELEPKKHKKSKLFRIFMSAFALANVFFILSKLSKGELKANKIKKEFYDMYKDNILNNDITAEVVEQAKQAAKKIKEDNAGRLIKLPSFGSIKDLITKRKVEVNLDELASKLELLKNTQDGQKISNTLDIYLNHIQKLKDEGKNVVSSKVDIPVVSGLYSGITKIFNTIGTILTAPSRLLFACLNKDYKDSNKLFDEVMQEVKPNYNKELVQLAHICELDKKSKLHEIFKSKPRKDSTMIDIIQKRARNVEVGAETSELANISRTMVTAITTYFFVNDYRNSVLIESGGKDTEGAKEETRERLMHKLSNFIINGTLMNTFNTIFKSVLNKSLLGATVVAAATETTNEFLVRKSICQPIGMKKSKQEIIDYEEKQMNKKGFMGWWSRTFKKITGKKSLTQKAGIKTSNK